MSLSECVPNRRTFLKAGAVLATGLSGLALFPEPATVGPIAAAGIAAQGYPAKHWGQIKRAIGGTQRQRRTPNWRPRQDSNLRPAD